MNLSIFMAAFLIAATLCECHKIEMSNRLMILVFIFFIVCALAEILKNGRFRGKDVL